MNPLSRLFHRLFHPNTQARLLGRPATPVSVPTKPREEPSANSSLRALTAAALALPGLTPSTNSRAATGDDVKFQYGYYEEGARRLFETNSKRDPIRVDNLSASGGITLFDRVKFLFNYSQDTWSGATPVTTAPLAGMLETETGASAYVEDFFFVDSQGKGVLIDLESGDLTKTSDFIHLITTASPETRKQADFRLSYEWDEAALDIGGGVSLEDDYRSRFVSASGRWDLNQKLTTLNLGLSYTGSTIEAVRDPLFTSYINYASQADPEDDDSPIGGDRQDWSVRFGFSQVLDKNSVFESNLAFTRNTGFLENPYKATLFTFLDPDQIPEPDDSPLAGLVSARTEAVLERRPDSRNQWTWSNRYIHYFSDPDAALHLDYSLFHDDWGINAHTFEAAWYQPLGNGWTVTPQLRYYSQDRADFYQPVFSFDQKRPTDVNDELLLDEVGIDSFSSDHRLSGYGALSGGLTVSKQVSDWASVEAGFEYYTHQGDLKLGGGGEGEFSDFDYFLVNVALRLDLSPSLLSAGEHGNHRANIDHGTHGGGHAPAGVMVDHMLPNAGDFMVGYRYMFSRQDGDMLHGSTPVGDLAVVNNACPESTIGCTLTSESMNMHMHMFNIMYAPTDWMNIMLMPSFMDMDMTLRELDGAAEDLAGDGHQHGGSSSGHATGGVGDTGLFALFKLYEFPNHHLHLGVGVNAPTGDVGLILDNGSFIHYGMQLGSGTWDLLPSLTYTGHSNAWSWGGQLSGIKRLEDANATGFTFGDRFQATAWGGYALTDWLSASVRGVYTTQGAIDGQYNGPHEDTLPADQAENYGGQFWDVGLGLNATVVTGDFKGNGFGIEWLQPVDDDFNGYQLERVGALFASWRLKF